MLSFSIFMCFLVFDKAPLVIEYMLATFLISNAVHLFVCVFIFTSNISTKIGISDTSDLVETFGWYK